jgi:protein TonB
MKTAATTTNDLELWEDIVFEKRNKEYGAYFIRKIYSKNVVLATLITFLSLGLMFAYPTIAEFFKSDDIADVDDGKKLRTVALDQPPPITPNQPPPPRLDVPPPVKTIKYVAPKVTTEEVPEEEIPTQEELKQVEVSDVTQEGEAEVVFEEPVAEVADKGDEDIIFTVVEQRASFPGGFEAMAKFLQRNLKYPASARRMGVDGKVFVEFIVDKEGKMSEIKVVKGLSADCDKEAVRVVQMMPPWTPGRQNGKAVKSKFVLPITFKLEI